MSRDGAPDRPRRTYDLVIVGGGTAGLVAAVSASGFGARVLLAERSRTGGDCLWTGCVPSKTLIDVAHRAHAIRTADAVGLRDVGEPTVDLAAVMAHVRGVQDAIAPHDSPERFRGLGVDVVEEHARFVAPHRLEVGGRTVRFRAALVATGSSAAMPPVEGLADVDPLTSDTVWDLTALPDRLLVLGAGAIGSELGHAFGRLGSAVTIVEMADHVLPIEEPEAGEVVAAAMRADGVAVHTGTTLSRIEPGEVPGSGTAVLGDGPDAPRVAFDRVLVAAGRRPVTDGLGLEALGVETTDAGHVVVDETLRTTAPGVFAAGDVTGELPFTHVAALHGSVVAGNALFHLRRRRSYAAVPWVTFTDPEVARVGPSVAEARERWGDDVVVRRVDHDAIDRALTASRPGGFTQLVADPKGRLVGATIVGPTAGEGIAEVVAWLQHGATLSSVAQATHAYPTYADAISQAGLAHLRETLFSPTVTRTTRALLTLRRLFVR